MNGTLKWLSPLPCLNAKSFSLWESSVRCTLRLAPLHGISVPPTGTEVRSCLNSNIVTLIINAVHVNSEGRLKINGVHVDTDRTLTINGVYVDTEFWRSAVFMLTQSSDDQRCLCWHRVLTINGVYVDTEFWRSTVFMSTQSSDDQRCLCRHRQSSDDQRCSC